MVSLSLIRLSSFNTPILLALERTRAFATLGVELSELLHAMYNETRRGHSDA